MPAYSEKVMDHFNNPRNMGEIENPDGVGKVGNPVCGDIMNLYIRVKNNRIVDAKFKTFGCGAAIATSSMVTEMVKGKTIEEVISDNYNSRLTTVKIPVFLRGLIDYPGQGGPDGHRSTSEEINGDTEQGKN